MLSLGSLSSSGAACKYYLAGNYYLDSIALSEWGGSAKELANLPEGPVQKGDFNKLLSGELLEGAKISRVQRAKANHNPGLDLTFTLPKSASLLAQGPNGEAIKRLHIKAVKEAMAVVELLAVKTRISSQEGKNTVGGQKILYALFHEGTSRADDSNIHTHSVMINMAVDKNGKVRAIYNRDIFKYRNTLGAVYRAVLKQGLESMGYQTRLVGENGLFEIKGISDAVIQTFSKRSQQIIEMAGGKNPTSKKRAQKVLVSRPKKSNLSLDELRPKWEAELASLGTSFEALEKEARAAGLETRKEKVPSPETVLNSAIRDLTERQTHWSRLDIYKAVYQQGLPHHTASQLDKAIEAHVKDGKLLTDKASGAFTTPNMVRMRDRLGEYLYKGHLKTRWIAPKLDDTKLGGHDFKLTPGQIAGGNLILSSYDRFIGIVGKPGTGKTTLFKTALPTAREAGHTLIGIAPSNTAVEALEETGVFDKVQTLQSYVRSPHGNKQTVLVLDEASMVSMKDMVQVMQFAQSRKFARVVISGDPKQLPAVKAGKPFSHLLDANMRHVKLVEIVRQKSKRHREAITDLGHDKIRDGLEKLYSEIKEVPRDKILDAVAKAWLSDRDDRTGILVQTNAQKESINNQIKDVLQTERRLNPDYTSHPSLNLTVWKPIHATAEMKKRLETYSKVTHIRFNRPVKRLRIKRGQIFRVKSINTQTQSLTLESKGQLISYKPSQHAVGDSMTELYHQAPIRLDKEDRIRFTRGGLKTAVNNNDMGTIKDISRDGITVKLDKGPTVTLTKSHAQLRHMDHGWTSTNYSYQGKTIEKTLVAQPSNGGPLVNQENLLVSISRHKDQLTLYTDDKHALTRTLEQRLSDDKDNLDVFKSFEIGENKSFLNKLFKTKQTKSLVPEIHEASNQPIQTVSKMSTSKGADLGL